MTEQREAALIHILMLFIIEVRKKLIATVKKLFLSMIESKLKTYDNNAN